MRPRTLLALGGVVALVYMNRREVGHFLVGTAARLEEGLRDLVDRAWNPPAPQSPEAGEAPPAPSEAGA